MRPRRNMRPADMTFTEDEVYGTPDAWDASDEPDAFSPLEMIQPGAEDVSDVDDPDLDAWLGRMAETSSASVDESMVPRTQDRTMLEDDPNASEYLANDALELAAGMRGEKLHPGLFTSEMAFGAGDKRGRRPTPNVDGSRIRPLDEVDASGIAPLDEADLAVPQMQPAPRAASLRKLSMQMRDGGSDDGYGAAEAQARNAYSGGQGWRALAAFLDPAGAPQRDAAAYDRAQQPIEAWKMQTARREQRSAREADQAAKMQKLAQDMRAQEAREAAQQRALDIREGQADPGSEWNQRRRGESEADWRARQQYAEDLRRGGVVHDAPFKNRNAALGSGSPASLRAIDARPMQPGAYRPVASAGDAMAEAVLQQFEIDQEPVPRHIEAMVNQLRDPNLDAQARTALRLALQGAVDTHRSRTDEGAAKIGAARRTENIPQTLAQINKVRELIGPTGDIPGMSRTDKLGRAILGDSLGQAISGPEGRRVQNQVDLLKDQLKRLQSGMATTAREDALFDRVLGTDLLASPDDFRSALQDLQDVLADRDAAIIQEAGPQAARVFSQRRRGAVNAAPGMQPSQSTPTNQRTVVKRQRNTATGQVRVVYSDGTSEIVNGP